MTILDEHELEPGADLTKLSLYMGKHDGVDLTGCKGRGVNAIGAKLRDSKLKDGDLVGILLCHCDLRDADFTNADLTDANLHGSDCTGAKWAGATLDRVAWHDVIGKPKVADDFEQWAPTVIDDKKD